MMPNYSKVIQVGHLVRDPEVKKLSTGTILCEGSIATTKKWKDNEHTTFVDFTMWGKSGEALAEYCKKGSAVLIEGELKQERWENAEGEKRSKIVINGSNWTFGGGKKDSQPVDTTQDADPATDNPGSLPF